MQKLITISIIAILALNALPAQAIQEREREQVRRKIRDVKSWQISRELGLSEEQARRFVPLQEQYDHERDTLRRERRQLEQELEVLVKDVSANGDRMRSVLLDIRNLDQRLADSERNFRARVYPMLTLEQQARYELFEKRFNAQIRKLIKDVRGESTRGSREGVDSRKTKGRDEDSRDRR